MTPLSRFRAGDAARWQILLDGKPLPTMESYATRENAECEGMLHWLMRNPEYVGRLTVAERGPITVEFGEPKL